MSEPTAPTTIPHPLTINVEDRVCYSRFFLQSTGQLTGDVPHARGTVRKIIPVGSMLLAVIDWDPGYFCPTKVNIVNLSKVTPERGIEESV